MSRCPSGAADPEPAHPGDGVDSEPADRSEQGDGEEAGEDARTQRRRLAGVWLAAGSAVAAMVFVSWYVVIRNGGQPPGGDMIGHAAAARWLQTLPWWDWRGWSDWFYGGQAMGVNYPPLGHALMRFTHPVHAQMAAVAIGLLVLLPWGTLRLARAVGYQPKAQRAAVALVFVLTAASADMHWILPGFHQQHTFFSSWPAALAIVAGLFAAAWAARGRSPVAAGLVMGAAALVNASYVPGAAVVCAALLATSGASFRQATRWAVTATATSIAVSAWWLVPFTAGRVRLTSWGAPLSIVLGVVEHWAVAVLAVLGVAAACAARRGGSARRLALAAAAGLLATLLGDLAGYPRSERLLGLSVLVACLAVAGLAEAPRGRRLRATRPTWVLLAAAFLMVFAVITLRIEVLPLAIWGMLPWRHRTWAWSGASTWAVILLLVPIWASVRWASPHLNLSSHVAAAAESSSSSGGGLMFVSHVYNDASGGRYWCNWEDEWAVTVATQGRVRPLQGVYTESSAASEFVTYPFLLIGDTSLRRPDWSEAWHAKKRPDLATHAAAQALGARWYVTCDADDVYVTELDAAALQGAVVAPFSDEGRWHRAAVEWWVRLASDATETGRDVDTAAVPALTGPSDPSDHPVNQPARGLSMNAAQDRLFVRAEESGWAWLRVPWDPYWRSTSGTPVHKGGPGHLVVWVERGTTELRWSVPGTVDAAAAAATGGAVLFAASTAVVNRRRGWNLDPQRAWPAASAFGLFADTVDARTLALVERLRRLRRGLVRR